MSDILAAAYPWIKALHIVSVIAWMAALLYLPRLFVYHAEDAVGSATSQDLLATMEVRLLKIIATPAMLLTWIFGILLLSIPGLINWGQGWPWVKLAGIAILTGFHMWLAGQRRRLAAGEHTLPSKSYRIINEIPTVLMIIIVLAVIVRPF